MNQRANRALLYLILLPLLILLVGCASPSQPSRFYRLESDSPSLAMPQSMMPGQTLPLVGVGPVQLASYLDRPQIIERSGRHRLELHEFDRWAGTLQENTVQVVSAVLQQALGNQAQVIGYPWHSAVRPDYELVLRIHRFERQGERIRLDARWILLAQPAGRPLRLGRQPFEVSVEGGGMEAAVAAASIALERLAETLAEELTPLLAPQH